MGELEPSHTDERVSDSVAEAAGGESLRFLWEDVVKVTALFPLGNKAWQKEDGRFRSVHIVLCSGYALGSIGDDVLVVTPPPSSDISFG